MELYAMRSPLHHIETVMSVVAAGTMPVVDGRAETLIHRSWFRCFNDYGLDPRSAHRTQIESPLSLRERRARREPYLQVARSGMEQLYRHVAELDYTLLLADADGVTVDAIGNPSSDSPLAAGLVLGANWNESVAGTNGIGTCLTERRTLTCHREDHYYTGNLGLSCTATPLFDPHGELMGVLDVSAVTSPEARESQHLARHLTSLYGRMIEDASFMQHFGDRHILRLSHGAALVDVNAELMLAFDNDGLIVGANTGARHRLHLVESAGLTAGLVGNSLTAIFRNRLGDIWKFARGQHGSDLAIFDTWNGERYHAAIVVPRTAPTIGTARTPITITQTITQHDGDTLQSLAGDDARMRQLLDQSRRLASKPVNLLIQGETGTGKEVLAKAIHESSQRADKPFVAVNCAAIPESLIESELFGYMPGTFTGARSRGMTGLIARSSGGTLFLDEIGDMPLQLQTRLLRVLSEHEVLPLGAERPVAIDLHVIAASHRDLRQLVDSGAFREDLYYRLCGATLRLSPLRERQDKAYLIERLLREEAASLEVDLQIGAEVLDRLVRYDWPGNIRQLRQVLRFMLSIADERGVRLEHLPEEIGVPVAPVSAPITLSAPLSAPSAAMKNEPILPQEGQRLLDALRRNRWNISYVARDLDLCRATIYRRMRRYGIVPPTHLH
jgi:transcriptional regulator of acetoin/glycerol metabolism